MMNMHHLTYAITISAPRLRIWQALTNSQSYQVWAQAFSQHSHFEGSWIEGETMLFVAPDVGGTLATLDSLSENRHILLRHIALIDKFGEVSTQGDIADKWIGSTEEYRLTDLDSDTLLTIEINTHDAFADMFIQCWPAALDLIKRLSEKSVYDLSSRPEGVH